MPFQGHSGGTKVDPALLDNVEVPRRWSEYLYHVGCSRYMHSILQSGLIERGKDAKKGRQTVFFTTLDPMNDEPEEEYQDLSKPRKIHSKSKWKLIQDAIYWITLKKAQDKGLTFWQIRCPAIIHHDFVPADCIEKVASTTSEEIMYQKTSTPSSNDMSFLVAEWSRWDKYKRAPWRRIGGICK